jgi:hypothetical protein
MVIVVITGGVTIIHHQSIATAKKKTISSVDPAGYTYGLQFIQFIV